jgi:quinol monooxygenase YgiN
MVLTILEARVHPDRVGDLKRAFEQTKQSRVPPFIVHSMLVRSDKDRDVWRIVTVFRSREALEAMRASGETPRGVAMFREAGAEPTLSVFDVADYLENATGVEPSERSE